MRTAIVPEHDTLRSIWIAYACFYLHHHCKFQFGGPTQVWAAALENDVNFVPLHYIKYCVAFCYTEVDFGEVISLERVIVVSPLT